MFLKFVSNDAACKDDKSSYPSSSSNFIPKWYRDAKIFAEGYNKTNLKEYVATAQNAPVTFKACIPFLDAMTAGYMFVTPCDIEVTSTDTGCTMVMLDSKFSQMIDIRHPMPGFNHPDGYYESHFHWYPFWGVEAPLNWSVLFTQPMNRFDLPFLTPSGIIDSDVSHINGRIPFFIKKNFNGIIPKNTPFLQLIPIQRQDWHSEYDLRDDFELNLKKQLNAQIYRPKEFPFYGAYKKLKWVKKNYN